VHLLANVMVSVDVVALVYVPLLVMMEINALSSLAFKLLENVFIPWIHATIQISALELSATHKLDAFTTISLALVMMEVNVP